MGVLTARPQRELLILETNNFKCSFICPILVESIVSREFYVPTHKSHLPISSPNITNVNFPSLTSITGSIGVSGSSNSNSITSNNIAPNESENWVLVVNTVKEIHTVEVDLEQKFFLKKNGRLIKIGVDTASEPLNYVFK